MKNMSAECTLVDWLEEFPELTERQEGKIRTSYCASCGKGKGLEKIGFYTCASCA